MRFIARLALFVVLALPLGGQPSRAAEPKPSIRLFMDDGQFISHTVRIFVEHEIPKSGKPTLTLFGTKSPFDDEIEVYPEKTTTTVIEPLGHAVNQTWNHKVEGREVTLTGTVLLYDISDYPMVWYKPVARATPMVSWTETGSNNESIGLDAVMQQPINVANVFPVYIWTLILVVATILLIAFLCHRVKGNPVYLLCEQNGKLSLSRSQIAAWSVAIGSMVFAFGVRKLEVPDLPDTLLLLMGFSLATGGVSYARRKTPPRSADAGAVVASPVTPKLWHLISDFGPDGDLELSIARSQMVLWTVLIIVLFVAKSFLDGVLWHVPMEMVFLMGMSQAGYLAPKIIGKPEVAPATPPNPDPDSLDRNQ